MEKETKGLIIFSLFIFFFVGGVFFYVFYLPKLEKTTFIAPPIKLPEKSFSFGDLTGDPIIDAILFEDFGTFLIQKAGDPSFLQKIQLVNLVHIFRENGELKIECKNGPAYESSNLQAFYPDELISVGRVKECKKETAQLIEKLAKSPERSCLLPLKNPIPKELNDYYLVVLAWKIEPLTKEGAQALANIEPNPKCREAYEKLIGQTIAIGTKVGIVDKKEQIFYP